MTAAVDSHASADDPSVLHVDKQRRYDRGIRVWGAHGQEALERARVCLLNCGPTGSEALKNLVLGGIQSFTIVDDHRVTPADLGNNYLVAAGALGSSRAACVTGCLKELNDGVAGSFVEEDPAALIASNPDFFSRFELVIATQLREEEAVPLDALCRARGVKLLLARAYGLAGFVRPCVAEHCVVESRPDSEVDDLRLGAPWAELESASGEVDLGALDPAERSHVPYGLLLVQAAQRWKAAHGGALPASAADRAAFKDLLRSWQRTADGVPLDEENFAEAVANAHKVWAPPSLSSELRAILDDDAAASPNLSAASPNFWVLVAALRRFVAAEGRGALPLDGSIPDMHATTQRYLALQRLYRAKAEADAAAVERHVRALLESCGRDPGGVPPAEVRHFCRHARHLRLLRCRPLAERWPPAAGGPRAEALRAALCSEEAAAPATLAVLLRAADRFHAQHRRFPGLDDQAVEDDVALLRAAAAAVLAEAGAAGAPLCDDLVAEVVRCGASELHVVGAVVGAVASQEAIKLLTAQFGPLRGTLVYDAIHCTTWQACFE